MRIALVCMAAAAAAACVGDKAELGGIDNRMAPPAATRVCKQDELRVVQKGRFSFPGDALAFYYMAGKDMPLSNMLVRYDVSEAGVPVNISYAGAAADMKHGTKQKLIRALVDGVASTRYQWVGAPGFGVGCTMSMDVAIRITREPI